MKNIMVFSAITMTSLFALTGCGGDSDSSGESGSVINTPGTSGHSNNAQAWLDAHNHYRQKHQVADLTWSDEVAKSAQAYVDTCPSGHSNSAYGENIAYSTAKQGAADVVGRWYNEVSEYDFNNGKFGYNTGHFTQVVWKNTTKLGCAQASNCAGKWKDIVVCQYDPPGNYQGQFSNNVLPAK